MILRDTCQYTLSDYLFQVGVFNLHDKKHVGKLMGRSFFWRHYDIVKFWNETAVFVGRHLLELTHNLDFSDEFYTIILVLTEPFHMFDGYNVARLEACSFVHLAEAALTYLFLDLVILQYFIPSGT